MIECFRVTAHAMEVAVTGIIFLNVKCYALETMTGVDYWEINLEFSKDAKEQC